jgi:cytochrome c-type biogenesis protein CcmF
MIPELGHFALILTLCLALVQTLFPLIGATKNIPNWMAVARPAAVGQAVFISIAYGCLTFAFVQNDFSVTYVASQSNTTLPLIYRVVSVWGGHEGSLLLWNMILILWTVAVVFFSKSLNHTMVARVIAVMGFISMGFLLFLLLTSNPFDRLTNPPLDGRDLNPLLQDPGLIFHPPLLYMGYVGFSVAFSFAIAALLGGKVDSAWARWSRPWTLVAWLFLTLGITLGSWWAYYELGWGGWWFWDPVENASFMPWLAGTALIHSLAVTEKRGAFKNWTVLLAILAFSLSLLGTFLVRSGVLTSVHAFATDPARGVFILAFLGVVIGLSLLLYAWRAPHISKGEHFGVLSRESLLLFNNGLLLVACASVLLGTLYPLFLDALGLGKISVGSPYFSKIFLPIMSLIVLLMGIGVLTRWKKDNITQLISRFSTVLIISMILGIALPLVFFENMPFVVLAGMTGAFWIIGTALQSIRLRMRRVQGNFNKPMDKRLFTHSFFGMTIAHIGIAIFIIGVVISNTYSIEKDVRLVPHKELTLANYRFVFEGTKSVEGENYDAEQATIRIFKADKEIAILHPQKRIYKTHTMPMTEAAIDPSITRDLYVALGGPLDKEGAWSVRIYYKPFIRWIWFGALFMALGGLLSATDKRYRTINN